MTEEQNVKPESPTYDNATDEAKAMHGGKAREERYEQPTDTVTLPGDTVIATSPAPDPRDPANRNEDGSPKAE